LLNGENDGGQNLDTVKSTRLARLISILKMWSGIKSDVCDVFTKHGQVYRGVVNMVAALLRSRVDNARLLSGGCTNREI
jgi:hypothetical protein